MSINRNNIIKFQEDLGTIQSKMAEISKNIIWEIKMLTKRRTRISQPQTLRRATLRDRQTNISKTTPLTLRISKETFLSDTSSL